MKTRNTASRDIIGGPQKDPWDCEHNLYISITAPDNPAENECIRNGCLVSSDMSLRYNLIFDAFSGQLARMGEQSYTPGLQILRVIGVDNYDHPVTLDFRFLVNPIILEYPKYFDFFCDSAQRIQEINLPRWKWRGLERIDDFEDDQRLLRRLLSDPNDLLFEHRQ